MSDIRARLEEMPLTAIVDRLEEIAERRTLDWQDAALLRYAAEALRAALASVSPTKDLPHRASGDSSALPHAFVGGYEIDPSNPATCQVCGKRHK